LLVQQFFEVEQYAQYINEKFIPFYVDTEDPWGAGLENFYEIGGGPSIAIIQSDGSLYDILTSYSDGEAEFYLERVNISLKGENAYATLKARHERNPDDLRIKFQLAQKHADMWQGRKAVQLAVEILEKSDEAKTIDVTLEEGAPPINLYEYARYGAGLGEMWQTQSTEPLEKFRMDFPESILMDRVYNDLARAYLDLPASDEGDLFFEDLVARYPDNFEMLRRALRYRIVTKSKLDKAENLALTMVEMHPESDDIRRDAAEILILKNKEKEALEIYGNDFIQTLMDKPNDMNSYAWFWALKETNLESALIAAQKAVDLSGDPNIMDTLSMVYWKMGEPEKAIQIEEEAYKMNPNPAYQERIKEIRKKMEGEVID
jgi:tetratricopeptide (TPR) repeat protein